MTHECEAPICIKDTTPSVWYPGETICGIKAVKLQKNQRRINKLVAKGTFKNMETYFTAKTLEKIGRITNSTKGDNPNR